MHRIQYFIAIILRTEIFRKLCFGRRPSGQLISGIESAAKCLARITGVGCNIESSGFCGPIGFFVSNTVECQASCINQVFEPCQPQSGFRRIDYDIFDDSLPRICDITVLL